ncbi:carboxypeptidase-like regulatory domain-containing protein [Granulicella pectinivorans]|uniref:carboxypeptidase-like regulatory domain-containing protein n=1 Tax=Granulicella pectinivorans TaxID=474950 RepID=UPI001FE4867F|nr:carboxypeptidase-like regulatory domain-containing protein [Granulicella pectinivorans]
MAAILTGWQVQAQDLPVAPGTTGSVRGIITDTDEAVVAGGQITLEESIPKTETPKINKAERVAVSDNEGSFLFADVAPGRYRITIRAKGFAEWKIEDVDVTAGNETALPKISLGVEALDTTVNAIFREDLAEKQISVEMKQRILGVLPNFYVSYVSDAQPLTRKQKFKLAAHVTVDPVTFFTTGVAAGIEQWQGDFSGYGQEFSGYAKRYGASYTDRVSSTFFGAALLPSLLHQDPRYFYKGHGSVTKRALYAISTVVICKGDNGKWQPNYSNVGGNLAAGLLSTTYYPHSEQHSVQITVVNTLIGTSTGAIGTLFQEFMLKHLTHGVPPPTP